MARVYRKRLEAALWKLLDMAKDYSVAVEFTDKRVDTRLDGGLLGYFDASTMQIVADKALDTPLGIRHIFTLAHEIRHVQQYRAHMWPMLWLSYIGVYPTYNNEQQRSDMEADADKWAKEFMIKNKLPVPIEEKRLT